MLCFAGSAQLGGVELGGSKLLDSSMVSRFWFSLVQSNSASTARSIRTPGIVPWGRVTSASHAQDSPGDQIHQETGAASQKKHNAKTTLLRHNWRCPTVGKATSTAAAQRFKMKSQMNCTDTNVTQEGEPFLPWVHHGESTQTKEAGR